MNTRAFTLLSIGLALAATGCGTPQGMETVPAGQPPRVEETRLQFDAAFRAGTSTLEPAEAARFESFLAQARVSPRDHVELATGDGDRLAAARIGSIVRVLAPHGVGAQTLPTAPTTIASNHLLVLVGRYAVTSPDCPNWTLPPDQDHGNGPGPNYGCATQTNLALMVDDPRDLVKGRVLGPYDAEPGLGAIARYRADTVKSLSGQGSAGSAAPGAPGGGTPGGSGGGGGT